MNRHILTPEELTTALKALDGWAADGNTIKKHLKFASFADALSFVNQVASLAESADHHPDIAFGWGYATLSLTTHDRGGVTDVDTALARRIDMLDPAQ